MQTVQDSASFGTRVHARIPVVLLLPSDLKRLVQFVRAAVERQLPHQAPAGESESAPSKKPDSLSS